MKKLLLLYLFLYLKKILSEYGLEKIATPKNLREI